jgi:heme a synthase
MSTLNRRFAAFAWGAVAYTVLVIVWGGFVRATGSGAGCGDHWPLCNGEVIPRSPELATLVEYSHRITSGLALLAVLFLYLWARRAYVKGALARRGAGWSLFFMITESLVGAALVLLELVAYNVSVARGYWMGAHLVNTFFLMGAMTLTAYWASGGGPFRFRGADALRGLVAASLVGTAVLGASGAVAALGDTLTLGGGIDPADDPVVATLVSLRIYHPLLAVVVFLIVGGAAYLAQVRPGVPSLARTLGAVIVGLFLVQMTIGLVNVALMAPVWIQMLHLFVTNLIWIALVVFAATALAVPRAEPMAAPLAVA